MSQPNYILCKWNSRLWPAKVLLKNGGSHKTSVSRTETEILDVEILCLDEQISVKRADTFPLETAKIEHIATTLGCRSSASHPPVEELTYRKALRVALDILSKSSKRKSSSLDLSDRQTVSTAAQKERKAKRSPPPTINGSKVVSPKKDVGRTRRSHVKSELRRSPRLSTSCADAKAKLKGQAPMNTKTGLSLWKASGPAKAEHTLSPRSRNPPAKATKEKKSATPQIGSTSPSPGESARVTSLRKRLHRDTLEPSPVSATESRSAIPQNAPVSGFHHSTVSTPVRKVSCANGRILCEKLSFSSKNAPREVTKMSTVHGNQEVHRSCSLKRVKCNPAESVACREHIKVGRCQSFPDPISSSSDSRISSKTPPQAGSRTLCTDARRQLPDFEVDEKELLSSDLSMEFSSPEYPSQNSSWVDGDAEDDEELPSILLHQEPCSMEPGMLVWCKYYKYPYWPAVVNYVRRKEKKASVLFVEESLADATKKTKKGVSVSLRAVKHFDCEAKQDLTEKARQEYGRAIDWCIALISDYRIRLGCGSFSGSFTEYCAAEISYPVRKEVQQDPFRLTFPTVGSDTEDSQPESTPTRSQPLKKFLPDRTRAARDKANVILVNYIVKAKRADKHLLAILKGERKSRWLHEFLHPSRYLTCVETYLEDEEQLEQVVGHLQSICEEMTSAVRTLINGDRIRFILDVLLPEAVIYAISAVDKIDYKKAEEKYMRGPSVSKREREIFEEQILDKKQRESQTAEAPKAGH